LFAVYIDDIGKLCVPRNCCFVILYSDDIILTSYSVTTLQNMLSECEKELTVALHFGVFSDPKVGKATLSPVLNNIVPNGSMAL